MKKTKENILSKSKELFNLKGVANVSIREISRELKISHSNLIYHYKDKNAILDALHHQILASAVLINQEIADEKDALKSLFLATIRGFEIIYDYRFFMIDFNLIMRENEPLHTQIKEIESFRGKMYEEKIQALIQTGDMRTEEFDSEYTHFIKLIRVYSDYWVSSAEVYEENAGVWVKTYVRLFLTLFYPYLTPQGKRNFDSLLDFYQLQSNKERIKSV